EADTIISQIFDLTSSGEVTIGKGALKQVSKELFNSIKRTAEASGVTKELSEFTAARANFRLVKETLENKLVSSIAENNTPELLGRLLARPGIGSRLGNLNNILSEKQIGAARRSFFEFLIDKATARNIEGISEGALVGDKFISLLDNVGEESLRKIFSPNQLSQILRFGRVANIANLSPEIPRPVSAQSVSLLSFGQGQAVAATVAGLGTGAIFDSSTGIVVAGSIIFGPAVIARMLANPKGLDLITKLTRLPVAQGTQASIRILNQLNVLLATDRSREKRFPSKTTAIPSNIP
ncbi:hypothetical protein LCGC14_2631570, partial [marine sediment metagenome]